MAVHQLDLIRFITGDDFVEATAWGRFDSPFRNGAESCALALLKMTKGACGVLHSTYIGPRVPYCEALTMFGENGTIIQHADHIGQYRGVFQYASATNKPTREWNDQHEGFQTVPKSSERQDSNNPFTNQLVHFAEALSRVNRFKILYSRTSILWRASTRSTRVSSPGGRARSPKNDPHKTHLNG